MSDQVPAGLARGLRQAVSRESASQQALIDRVVLARSQGYSWRALSEASGLSVKRLRVLVERAGYEPQEAGRTR